MRKSFLPKLTVLAAVFALALTGCQSKSNNTTSTETSASESLKQQQQKPQQQKRKRWKLLIFMERLLFQSIQRQW